MPPPKQPDALPRAIPPAIIDRIFETMPTRRYARKLTAAQTETVRRQALKANANRTAIARAFGISEAMVRKIVAGRMNESHDAAGKSRARLRVMATVGLPPAALMQVTREDIDLERASVLAHGRKKGAGALAVDAGRRAGVSRHRRRGVRALFDLGREQIFSARDRDDVPPARGEA